MLWDGGVGKTYLLNIMKILFPEYENMSINLGKFRNIWLMKNQ